MPSRRIVNASPLILLTKAERLDLLWLGGVEVIVPDAVAAEIEAGEGYDCTAEAIRQETRMSVTPSPPILEVVRACNLDPGETAVLAMAYGDRDSEVVLDDLAARRWATRLRIPCLGPPGWS